MFNLQFLPSVSSYKAAVDTLHSFAVFPPRDLKFRLTAQASLQFVECVVLLQRNALQFFSVEKRGGILKGGGGDPSPPLPLAVQGGSEGLLTARHPFENIFLHFYHLTIKSEIGTHRNAPPLYTTKFSKKA